jgi:hypothetical protein
MTTRATLIVLVLLTSCSVHGELVIRGSGFHGAFRDTLGLAQANGCAAAVVRDSAGHWQVGVTSFWFGRGPGKPKLNLYSDHVEVSSSHVFPPVHLSPGGCRSYDVRRWLDETRKVHAMAALDCAVAGFAVSGRLASDDCSTGD